MTIHTILVKEVSVFAELFLGIALIYVVLYGTFLTTSRVFPIIQSSVFHLCLLILSFSCLLLLNDKVTILKLSSFNNTVLNDYVSSSSKIIIGTCGIICLSLCQYYVKLQKVNSFEYGLLFLFSLLGFFLLCSANDIITAYLAIELQSISFYVLAAFKKDSTFSIDAGLKYFILGAFASSIFLLGASIIYGCTGTLNFLDLNDLFFWILPENSALLFSNNSLSTQLPFEFLKTVNVETTQVIYEQVLEINVNYNYFNPVLTQDLLFYLLSNNYISLTSSLYSSFETSLLKFAILFLIISIFFKLALAPFHLWAPDVYEGSLTSSTVFFAIMPKLGLFILLIRIVYSAFFSFLEDLRHFIVFIAVISIIIGSIAGLEQRKLKNLLAYSSISHMGYALLSFSTGTFEGLQLVFCYLIIYMYSGLGLWGIIVSMRLQRHYIQKQNTDITDFMLLGKSNKTIAFFFMVIIFSIAGIPPMIGFLVKLSVFLVSIEAFIYYAAFIAIIISVISAFYYIRLIKLIYFEKGKSGQLYHPLKSELTVFIVLVFYFLIFLFLNPNLLFLITHKFGLILLS